MTTDISINSDSEKGSAALWVVILLVFFGACFLLAILLLQDFSGSSVDEIDSTSDTQPLTGMSPNMETAPAIPGTTAPVTPTNPTGPDEGQDMY